MDTVMINHEPIIYTTGAHLSPIKAVIDGEERWMWTVSEFGDDSFKDGDVFNPPESANTLEELLTNTSEEE